MNFMDNPIKNMFSTKSEPVENKVCDTSHIKHEGETYKQYGLRVAGLSEGSLHYHVFSLFILVFAKHKKKMHHYKTN